eukprot:TRINITY_DN7306_c0_g1_i2.p1 TRINITY_DN7306_c0_g1~~TRINITY_DN7306_c0_g1_i2.p1  ORF type:complete len:469 (-),score=139.78 TRINITY_DN7306_c0_g1_i2:99-1505(-)
MFYPRILFFFFFFSSRRRHTRCREVSWARRCVQETGINAEYMGKKGKVVARNQLVINKYLGPCVFKNCSGFLKIIDHNGDNTIQKNLLDITRIHPESYFIAEKIATEAISDEIEGMDINDTITVLTKVMKNPEKLKNPELKRVEEQLERANYISNKLQMEFVIKELSCPFEDPRPKHEDIGTGELFYLQMGETEQTFYPGIIVSVTVVRVQKNVVWCKLENGMEAIIKREDVEGADSTEELSSIIHENSVIPARVSKITPTDSKCEVCLTTRRSELLRHNQEKIKLSEEDRRWLYINEKDLDNKKLMEDERKKSVKYTARKISHKNYKNVSFMKANEYLKTKESGEFLFRPSSRGNDHLTLTMKLYKNINVHVDIIESEKPRGALLGKKLLIGNECYESLDEIEARFITPIIDFAKETSTLSLIHISEPTRPLYISYAVFCLKKKKKKKESSDKTQNIKKNTPPTTPH